MSKEERAAWMREHGHGAECEREDCRGCLLPRREPRRAWLVAPIAGGLIARLSKGALGWCNATEGSLRIMIAIDTGYIYGPRSIGRWILREWRAGRLLHKRARPGWYFHRTKMGTNKGTQLNRWPNESERREKLWRSRNERRKQRRERVRQLQHAAEEKKRREREERRRRRLERGGEELVRLAAPAAELPLVGDDHAAAVHALVAATFPRTPAATQVGAYPTEAERELALRAKAREDLRRLARELGETLPGDTPPPSPPDDDPPDER